MIGPEPATTLIQAAKALQSATSASVTLTLARKRVRFTRICGRERFSTILATNGQKLISGVVVPTDTDPREVDQMLTFNMNRYVTRIFPSHYPPSPETYYGGFEIFMLKNPSEITIGGIETGPASRAGAHWGDVLVSVNNTPVNGKTPLQLQRLFSSSWPKQTQLKIRRLGTSKILIYRLAMAAEIAKSNGKRFVDGQIVPSWVSSEDLPCFLK